VSVDLIVHRAGSGLSLAEASAALGALSPGFALVGDVLYLQRLRVAHLEARPGWSEPDLEPAEREAYARDYLVLSGGSACWGALLHVAAHLHTALGTATYDPQEGAACGLADAPSLADLLEWHAEVTADRTLSLSRGAGVPEGAGGLPSIVAALSEVSGTRFATPDASQVYWGETLWSPAGGVHLFASRSVLRLTADIEAADHVDALATELSAALGVPFDRVEEYR
jgi:hypothetical protein